MRDEDQLPRGSRLIRFPPRAVDEDEYEALRNAKRAGHAQLLERKIRVPEASVIRAAEIAAESGIDPRPFLEGLRQPAPSLGIPRDCRQGGRVVSDMELEERVRLSAPVVRALGRCCDLAIRDLDCHERLSDGDVWEVPDGWYAVEGASQMGLDDVCEFLLHLSVLLDFSEASGVPILLEKMG